MIDLDHLDRHPVDPAVAFGERRRSSAYHGGAIGRDRGRPWCLVGPSVQLDSKTVRSQIKIHSPMIIIISAQVPQPGCYAQDPDGVSADLPQIGRSSDLEQIEEAGS